MLGMMNVSTDQVEFYAANSSERKYTSQISEEQTKAFTEAKQRKTVSYTPDGRRLINGNLEKEVDGVQLWHEAIKKRLASPTRLAIPGVDPESTTDEEEEDEAVTVAEGEPVVPAALKKIKERAVEKQ